MDDNPASFFLEPFINTDIKNFKYMDVKELGVVINSFSHVYGRTILIGTLTYESYKNYRCKKEFEKHVLSNPLNKPVVIFIHDWGVNDGAVVTKKFDSFKKLFNGCYDEIKDIENKFLFEIKPPKINKNGKPQKHFNINRKKRFRIPVINGMSSDGRIIPSTIISCTFRDLK